MRPAMQFHLDQAIVSVVIIGVAMAGNFEVSRTQMQSCFGWPFVVFSSVKVPAKGSTPGREQVVSLSEWDWTGLALNALVWSSILVATNHVLTLLRTINSKTVTLGQALKKVVWIPVAAGMATVNLLQYSGAVKFGVIDIWGKWPTRGWPFPFHQYVDVVGITFQSWDLWGLAWDLSLILIVAWSAHMLTTRFCSGSRVQTQEDQRTCGGSSVKGESR
jgi:hypothetical protein